MEEGLKNMEEESVNVEENCGIAKEIVNEVCQFLFI